ncbi:MAG: phenylalanine--tRNA ligase subunit beta, partial [Anaerolineae bacterium]
RLLSAGMRPINVVVDITNYVMLEWGQPLHAFDYDRLPREDDTEAAPRIVVRRARAGERMTTLDDVERTFDPDSLLITTGETPVAVAGVMGGADTEVDEGTRNVLLEAANFEFINNRRTAQALRLPSEATSRFGRGVDPEFTLPAARRAAELMRQLAGATVAKGVVDAYPLPPPELRLEITSEEVRRVLGMEVPRSRVVEILTALEFECEEGPDDQIAVTVPSHRLDVSIPADLIEEVARVIGYDKIPATLMRDSLPPQRRNHRLEHEERIRDLLVGVGLSEVITHSLTRAESLAKLSPGETSDLHLRLANPISADHVVLRTTLKSGLLENLSINLRHRPRGAIFELARVYLPQADELLPREPRRLAIALAGPREESGWASGPAQAMDYYDLKGLIQAVLERLRLPDMSFVPTDDPSLLPGRAARMELDGKPLGALGEVHPRVREAFSLPDVPVALAEMDLEALFQLSQQEFFFHPIPRFPGVEEDLAVIVDEAISAGEIRDAILEAGQPLLEQANLFDVYRGEQIPDGRRGLAFSLVFRAPDRTLTEEEVRAARKRIEGQLEDGLGALPRD